MDRGGHQYRVMRQVNKSDIKVRAHTVELLIPRRSKAAGRNKDKLVKEGMSMPGMPTSKYSSSHRRVVPNSMRACNHFTHLVVRIIELTLTL
jgi:hypothetical protein